jgi:hypothetical protein
MPAPERRYQPARDHMYEQRWTVSRAAVEIGVPYTHLRCVLMGTASPSPEVRQRLPELLGIPLVDLFDEDLLARPFRGPNNHARARKAAGGAGRG